MSTVGCALRRIEDINRMIETIETPFDLRPDDKDDLVELLKEYRDTILKMKIAE